jgi:hypothetical protein
MNLGHMVIDKKDSEFYGEIITKPDISETAQANNRWIAWTVVMKIVDLWLPDHFERICSAINMLPASLNFEVSEASELQSPCLERASSRSGLS